MRKRKLNSVHCWRIRLCEFSARRCSIACDLGTLKSMSYLKYTAATDHAPMTQKEALLHISNAQVLSNHGYAASD